MSERINRDTYVFDVECPYCHKVWRTTRCDKKFSQRCGTIRRQFKNHLKSCRMVPGNVDFKEAAKSSSIVTNSNSLTTTSAQVERLEKQDLRDQVQDVWRLMPYRMRLILGLRWGLQTGYCYSLLQVGRVLKISRERVRTLEARALKIFKKFYVFYKFEGVNKQELLKSMRYSYWKDYNEESPRSAKLKPKEETPRYSHPSSSSTPYYPKHLPQKYGLYDAKIVELAVWNNVELGHRMCWITDNDLVRRNLKLIDALKLLIRINTWVLEVPPLKFIQGKTKYVSAKGHIHGWYRHTDVTDTHVYWVHPFENKEIPPIDTPFSEFVHNADEYDFAPVMIQHASQLGSDTCGIKRLCFYDKYGETMKRSVECLISKLRNEEGEEE